MDAEKTTRQIFAFALAMIAALGFFVWMLGPWGPKTAEPSDAYCDGCNGQPPSLAASPAQIQSETLIFDSYECLRVYQGSKELHWQCFKVPAP